MKKTLLFIFTIASFAMYAQTNLVLNSTLQEHTNDTNDNADSFDMTPPSSIKDNSGASVASPYRAIWNNTDLDDWLNTNCKDSDEQPGSSSDGNWDYSAGAGQGVKTRGLKISEKCRRLYQVINVTQGTEYTFSIESRSEKENVNSEVFILNTEITSEDGLPTTKTGSVDAYLNITNDFNSSKSNATDNNFTTNTITFTATTNKVVIYVRASAAVDSSHDVFYDNVWLYDSATASVDDYLSAKIKFFPNPTKDVIKISTALRINKLEVYNVIGKKVSEFSQLENNSINVSNLSSGVYFLKIMSNEGNLTKKFIKE